MEQLPPNNKQIERQVKDWFREKTSLKQHLQAWKRLNSRFTLYQVVQNRCFIISAMVFQGSMLVFSSRLSSVSINRRVNMEGELCFFCILSLAGKCQLE